MAEAYTLESARIGRDDYLVLQTHSENMTALAPELLKMMGVE